MNWNDRRRKSGNEISFSFSMILRKEKNSNQNENSLSKIYRRNKRLYLAISIASP